MQILTKRFLLREFTPEDADAFEAYHADPRMKEFYSEEQAAPGHVRELMSLIMSWADESPRTNYQFAVERLNAPGKLIGCCGLRRAENGPGRAELGIELAPEHWGRYRYAEEIILELLRFGFGTLGLDEIYGIAVSANTRIGRLVKLLGADAHELPTPEWMLDKGWRRIEWSTSSERWKTRED